VLVNISLPENLAIALAPLFAQRPLESAMDQLVVRQGADRDLVAKVEELIKQPPFQGNAPLKAGLWLYVDELDRSHVLSQHMKDATGAFWHGIMHRREGDFGNAQYWFHQSGPHPAMKPFPAYNAHDFVKSVEALENKGEGDRAALVKMQQDEWLTLMAWCSLNG